MRNRKHNVSADRSATSISLLASFDGPTAAENRAKVGSTLRTPSPSAMDLGSPGDDGDLGIPTKSLLDEAKSPGLLSPANMSRTSFASPALVPTPMRGGGVDLTAPQSNLVSVWSTWVLVFGFPSGFATAALRSCMRYGEVLEHHEGQGNWLFVRYRFGRQAAEAVANGSSVKVGENVLVAISPLNEEKAAQLGFRLNGEGGGFVEERYPTPVVRMNNYEGMNGRGDEDIMQAPRKKRGVCARIMAMLFNL